MDISMCIVSGALGLHISSCGTTGDDLHALFTFIWNGKRAIIARHFVVIIIIEDNDFAERLLDFVAHLTSLVSPLFELRQGNRFYLGPGVQPAVCLEELVIIRIGMADMSDDSKLDFASQREVFRITYPGGTLYIVSE